MPCFWCSQFATWHQPYCRLCRKFRHSLLHWGNISYSGKSVLFQSRRYCFCFAWIPMAFLLLYCHQRRVQWSSPMCYQGRIYYFFPCQTAPWCPRCPHPLGIVPGWRTCVRPSSPQYSDCLWVHLPRSFHQCRSWRYCRFCLLAFRLYIQCSPPRGW